MTAPRIEAITAMPEIFDGFRKASLIGKAIEKGLFDLRIHALRDHARDKHRMIDDRPFGGGAGMVMKPEPLFSAIETARSAGPNRLILLTPQGERFTQEKARALADWLKANEAPPKSAIPGAGGTACPPDAAPQILLICGRYEGVDERVIEHFRPESLSIGDYVIAGGEVAAMVVIEAVTRLLPGVIGNEESIREESFNEALIEYPQYTRPALFREHAVPEILLSGDHAAIAAWRRERMIERTRTRRPDLLNDE